MPQREKDPRIGRETNDWLMIPAGRTESHIDMEQILIEYAWHDLPRTVHHSVDASNREPRIEAHLFTGCADNQAPIRAGNEIGLRSTNHVLQIEWGSHAQFEDLAP